MECNRVYLAARVSFGLRLAAGKEGKEQTEKKYCTNWLHVFTNKRGGKM